MCEFKYCQGSGICFLSKTSPCAGFEKTKPAKDRPRSIRMRYEGFLDQDELLAVLEPANAKVQDEERHETIGRLVREDEYYRKSKVKAAPRFLRLNSDNSSGPKSSAA